MNIRPFSAVRPNAEDAALVAAGPYDVVDTAEAKELAAGNPKSFLHVSRPEIDLPDGTDCSYVQGTGHLQYRHNGRLNVVMYDGHVKSFSEPELFENSDKYYGQLRYGFSWGCNYCNKGKY